MRGVAAPCGGIPGNCFLLGRSPICYLLVFYTNANGIDARGGICVPPGLTVGMGCTLWSVVLPPAATGAPASLRRRALRGTFFSFGIQFHIFSEKTLISKRN